MRMRRFLSAIPSVKLIAPNKHPSRGCYGLAVICQLSREKQCGLGDLLKDTTY